MPLLTRIVRVSVGAALLLNATAYAYAGDKKETAKKERPHSSLSAPKERTNVTRWYKAYWLNNHVGNLIVQIEERDGLYHVTSRMEATGVAKITKYWNEAVSTLQRTESGYLPVAFHNTSNLRKKRRTIDLHYDPNGQVVQESVNPADNPGKRPPVSEPLKIGTIDPHTAILIAHKEIRAALDTGKPQTIRLPIYAGRQLGDYMLHVHGKIVDEFNGKKQSAIRVTLTRKAIAGFTESELERMKREDPEIDFYLSDDAQMLPIKVYAKAPIGHAVAILEKECYAIDRCHETPKNFSTSAYNRIR